MTIIFLSLYEKQQGGNIHQDQAKVASQIFYVVPSVGLFSTTFYGLYDSANTTHKLLYIDSSRAVVV